MMDTRSKKRLISAPSRSVVKLKREEYQSTLPQASRKSGRKCRSLLKKEKLEQWKEKVRIQENIPGLKVVEFEEKGRGVVSSYFIPRGSYVCEYCGKLLTREEALLKEREYERDTTVGCYMYYFVFQGEKYCVDATAEDGTSGRLINHSRTLANLKSQGIEVDETPHLIFYATRDIKPEEELLYDYGDRSTVSLTVHPWLKS